MPRLEARPCPPVPPAPSTPVGPGRCCLVRCVVSKPGQALPPPTGTAARPSTPVGPCRLMVAGASSRSLAWPRRRPRAQQPGQRGYRAPSNFARNSPGTLSGFELASLELQRFWRLLKVHAIELRAKFLVGVCVLTHGRCGPDQQSREHITRELRRSAPRNTMGPSPRRPRVVSGMNQGKPP